MDARAAVRHIYDEHLQERYPNPNHSDTRLERLNDFDNDRVRNDHRKAIQASTAAYIEEIQAGATQARAVDTARDAFYAEFLREEVRRKEVHGRLYQNSESYRDNADAMIAQKIADAKAQRDLERNPQPVIRNTTEEVSAAPVQPMPDAAEIKKAEEHHQSAKQADVDRRPPRDVDRVAEDIRVAHQQSTTALAFAAALSAKNLYVACVTADEAQAYAAEQEKAAREGRSAPAFREGEYVVLTDNAEIYRLTPRTIGQTIRETENLVSKLDGSIFPGVEEVKQLLQERAEAREAENPTVSVPEGMSKAQYVDEILASMGNMHSHVDIEREGGGYVLIRTYEIDDELLPEYGVPGEQELGWAKTLEEMHDAIIESEGPYFERRRAEEEHERREHQSQSASSPTQYMAAEDDAEIDLARFRTDPDYQRSVEQRESQRIDERRRLNREEFRNMGRDFGQR